MVSSLGTIGGYAIVAAACIDDRRRVVIVDRKRYVGDDPRPFIGKRWVVALHVVGDDEWDGGHYTDSFAAAMHNFNERWRASVDI